MKSIETKSIEAGEKVLIDTNTFFSKCIENTQYKYFLKVLKIQIVLNTKGMDGSQLKLLIKWTMD